jgi:hypothetical protein
MRPWGVHLAPTDRRRLITLAELPPGAVFTCLGTRWRGLLICWHRTREGDRREASVLLLHARGDDSAAIRKTLRASISVEIAAEHDVLNLSTRDVTAADAFAHQMVVRRGAEFPAYDLLSDDGIEETTARRSAPMPDVQLPEAA